ncbi:cation-translocating P-type ATPase C-terminal domain-containing protein [Chitinophagaceae bacterium LB-8]|uniref:Cation-translocating P-type ATPase C-terminal domain-containing protein n=1 Tax=Paraflavisolibacter caeni TaxID=2982496 RepID=A0A9X3BHF8_9BACT|nr:cation-translocating P-type ATPase C-terminal domain-containing protein [Paraflavisolibacter caeni]MCU7552294.1 cation-translocating P-type ATPase C-terminal domain-containing protein [Paraflavisolibacter caeni]
MGPTCSVFYEREPVEENLLRTQTKNRFNGLFKSGELLMSIIQGLMITGSVLLLYYIFMRQHSLALTRTIVFTMLICSNVFLTFANRSFTENITQTIRYQNNLALPIFIISGCFLALFLFVPFIRALFGFTPLTLLQFLICASSALISLAWFEVY